VSPEGRLRIGQHQTACCYIEGQISYLIVRDAAGESVVEHEFTGSNAANPVIDVHLPAGSYEVESYQRPCDGNCGYLDPPTDRCVDSVVLPPDGDVFLTVEFAPGEGCEFIRAEQPSGTTAASVVARFSVRYEHHETGTTYCPVLATNFVDRSTGRPTSWRWEFPGGSTSTEQHPRLEEAVAGVVTLTVSNGESSDTITQDVSYAVC
jgi:hypothetical protein